MPGSSQGDGTRRVILAPGEIVTDPGRAEQLGLTADAQRMRREGQTDAICASCGHGSGAHYFSEVNRAFPCRRCNCESFVPRYRDSEGRGRGGRWSND